MKADLKKLYDFALKTGFKELQLLEDTLKITLFEDTVLEIANINNDKDSEIGFDESGWHAHDSVSFVDTHNYYIDLDYYQILEGIMEGTILIADETEDNRLISRYLIHQDYFNELQYLKSGVELRIRKYS